MNKIIYKIMFVYMEIEKKNDSKYKIKRLKWMDESTQNMDALCDKKKSVIDIKGKALLYAVAIIRVYTIKCIHYTLPIWCTYNKAKVYVGKKFII